MRRIIDTMLCAGVFILHGFSWWHEWPNNAGDELERIYMEHR